MSREFRRDDRPGLYCVELRTDRWEESVTWYREVLGLRVLVRVTDEGYALLEAGETRLALLRRQTPGEPTRRISLAFEISDLRAVALRIEAAGIPVARAERADHELQELNTTDPDGNRVRLFSWPSTR
jgi:catechol 2,3-dioxygenase-like lactoylglutathione lyase family enzyme